VPIGRTLASERYAPRSDDLGWTLDVAGVLRLLVSRFSREPWSLPSRGSTWLAVPLPGLLGLGGVCRPLPVRAEALDRLRGPPISFCRCRRWRGAAGSLAGRGADDLRRGGGVIVLGGVYSGRPPPVGGAFRGPIDAQSEVARSGVRDPGCFPDHDEEV